MNTYFQYACLYALAYLFSGCSAVNINDIRLADGDGTYQGRVEINIDGVWGTVCDYAFDMADAVVMCRMMNLTAAAYHSGAYFGKGVGPVFAREFHCTGSESHLDKCTFVPNEFFCVHASDVSITCTECEEMPIANGEIASIFDNGTTLVARCDTGYESNTYISHCDINKQWTPVVCTPIGYPLNVTSMGLVNGTGLYDGRVELLVNGTWGTVCSYTFGNNEAIAICRILGYNSCRNYWTTSYYYGEGTGPIHVTDLNCPSGATDFNNCTYKVDNTCTHYSDVAVSCDNAPLNITDIRLTNDTEPYEGRVELMVDGEWGTVCSTYVGNVEASTLCNMMNLSLGTYYKSTVMDEDSTPVLIGSITCSTVMDHVNDCSYHSPGIQNCPQSNALYLRCLRHPLNITGIRLVNGIGLYDGRVELRVNDTWGTVCSSSFESNEADAICRTLGYNSFRNYWTTSYYYGKGTGPIFITDLDCPPDSTDFNNCTYKVEDSCTHYSDVAVSCDNAPLNITDIRLNGTGPYGGRVELMVDGVWGTICSTYVGNEEASTLCNMMNSSLGTYNKSTDLDEGIVFIGEISCSTAMDHVNDCSYYSPGIQNCPQSNALSLICLPCSLDFIHGSVTAANGTNITITCDDGYEPEETYVECFENGSVSYDEVCIYKYSYPLNISDFRMVESRFEIMVEGEWGTVCYNGFDSNDANVICKMFGLNYRSHGEYGNGNGLIFMHNLLCNGSESHISECNYNVTNNCTHEDDVTVACTEYPLNITDIRLNSSISSRQGRVEVKVGDEWGTVCHDGFGSEDALVICRMLGFNISYSQVRYFPRALFGRGNGEIYVEELSCSGDEYHINDCNYLPEHNCGHHEDVSVSCLEDYHVIDARLVNGTSMYDGRAEVKVNGTWGTICDHNFGILQADTFCVILGKRATQYFPGARYGEGRGIMYDTYCSGSEISSCQYEVADRCTHERDASVICTDCGEPDISHWGVDYFTYNGATLYAECFYYKSYVGTLTLTCNNGSKKWVTEGECMEYSYPLAITDIRLVGGESISSGRVEIKSIDTWGTICDHSFGMNEASVICSMIGFTGALAFYPGAYFGEGSGPIFIDDLSCGENATDINDCSYVTYDDCWHSDDVSVVCTDCGNPIPLNGYANSTLSNEGAVIKISCNENYKLIGDAVVICQNAVWSDQPSCKLIDCGDPKPENGFLNGTETTKGTVVTVWCDTGYTILGNAVITCLTNESWTDSPICEINDCGLPDPENADFALYNNETTYGENAIISCTHGYIPDGSVTVSCLENSTWERWPDCELIDCGNPSPIRGFRNSSDSTYGSVVHITCEQGYNISGNPTISCQGDGTWNESPTCDASDCGLLPVANGFVKTSQGTTVGSVTSVECDTGYDLIGSSLTTCIETGERASWNLLPVCQVQVCRDPTPDDGHITNADGTNMYVFGDIAKIECNIGYELKGDNLITCDNGGVWSNEPICVLFDCGPLPPPANGSMDDSQGTKYNTEIRFHCNHGYLLVGEDYSACGETGHWSNKVPLCVAKSAVGGYCQNEDYCLLEDSKCINSVCSCITGIYDTRTNICDAMPLMPFGTETGDVYIPNGSMCGSKITFVAGFPIYEKMYTDLYVCSIGYLSFGTQFSSSSSPGNNNDVTRIGLRGNLLAPFYGPIDYRNSGPVFYRSYSILNTKELNDNADLILNIESVVRKFGNVDLFHACFILIATWYEHKPESGFDKTKTATFQLLLVTDGKSTYAYYIYGNGMMNWINNLSTPPPIWIGDTVDSVTYSHPLAFSNAALHLGDKLTDAKSEQDVSGLVVRSLNTQGIKHENAAVDCIRWYNENYEEKQRIDYIVSLAPKCPCDIRLSRFDPWFWRIGLTRPSKNLNYKCVDMLPAGNFRHFGKSCCYDLKTGRWLKERPLAGSFHLFNSRYPLEHELNDVQPKRKCCVLSKYCNLYYELRPTGLCYGKSPYNFGAFWGDPHFSTLDGTFFTFNGLGEYTLLQINTGNCSFELQARTERALKGDGNLSDATVFTAFAAKVSADASVYVERNKEMTAINLYGNGEDLTEQYNSDESDGFMWSSHDNNLAVTKQNNSVHVFAPACDISLTISISVEMLTLLTLVSENLKNETKGLLGNYNGDASDDFIMPNGTVLKANLTEREIFAYGRTWAITPNNSAFLYDVGKSHFDFHNDSYMPRFLDEADPEVRLKAEDICNGSKYIECVFDYVSTQRSDIAIETKRIKEQFEADKMEIDETVPTFEGCSTVNVTKGQNASCKLNVEEGDTIHVISSNVSVEIDQESSTITFVPETDEPISIRVSVSNENGRYSPIFAVNILMCTACNDHGVCTGAPRIDSRENEYFHYLTCECDSQFEGIDCERAYDGCAANPCSLERNCTTLMAEEQTIQNKAYSCGPCPDGFDEDINGECIDKDECASSNGNCDQNCTNTDGTFVCSCSNGYRVDSRNSSLCKDINECEEAVHNCDHVCNNTDGGFTCQCYAGYELNTTSRTCVQILDGWCTDIQMNDCTNTHGCTTVDNDPVCFCKDGYELAMTGTYCQDIDECRRGVCQQKCVNTDGSFECICFAGYRLEGLTTCIECDVLHWGANCEQDCVCIGRGADRCDPVKGCICKSGWYGGTCNDDINECESDIQVCENPRKTCINNLGSYSCECRTGFYETDQGECEDTDECSEPHLNNCTQECKNVIGRYACGCTKGYTKYDQWSCEDINECELRTHSCEQRCVNNDGHYSCFCHYGYSLNDDRRTCSKFLDQCLSINNLTCSHFCQLQGGNAICGCKNGFKMESDNVTCTDINECVDDDENKCDEDGTCINKEGSYICECPDGQQLENDGRTCTECDDNHYGRDCLHTCSCLYGVCDKQTGCICDSGWSGTLCDIDIDECSTEQVLCLNEHSVCVNVLGSALCSCETGYRNNGGICQDIDECDDSTTNECDQICTNTEGNYTCSCHHGFLFDGKCEDIDECTRIHDCDQICENTVGSYRCSCEEGFRLNLDNRKSCIVKQECNEEHNNTCPQQSTCFVNNGVVNCKCLRGYQGNDCIDIDECMMNLNPCSHYCSNTEGSFSCSCDVGFSLLEDTVSCKDINECDQNDHGCLEVCVNVDGSYYCACPIGYSGTGNYCTDSPILIEATVTIEINLPIGTSLNVSSVYTSIELKLLATLRLYFKRFTSAVLDIIITDIRMGSIVANYSARYGTDDMDVASNLVGAIVELRKGTELVYDGQTVNASSDSYKGSKPCEILYAIVGSCGEGYTCYVENNIPVCSVVKEHTTVNVFLIIGLSAAGLFVLIAAAPLVIRRLLKKKVFSARRDLPEPSRERVDDEASDFYKTHKWQDGRASDAGRRLPSAKYFLPRIKSPVRLGELNQSYNNMPDCESTDIPGRYT